MYHELINHATRNYPFLIEHINVKYIPHFHEEPELVYVMEGNLNVTIGNNGFVLKENEICIFTPGVIHNLYSHEYNKSFVMKLFPAIDISNIQLNNAVITPASDNYDILKNYISDIINENTKKAKGYELAANIIAEKILLYIIRNTDYHILENTMQIKRENESDFLNSVTAFLEQHYAEQFSLEEVAKHLNFTKSYFCHYFKEVTGVTFWNYYTLFRLEKAIQMMKENPSKKYIEISENSGFKNIRTFNESFRKYHMCTPREYIRKYYKAK